MTLLVVLGVVALVVGMVLLARMGQRAGPAERSSGFVSPDAAVRR